MIPARFHLVAITGDGPALAKLSCTSFATNGPNCRCCVDDRASKFVLGVGEEPNKKRDDVEHIEILKGLQRMTNARNEFKVDPEENRRRFRNAIAEENLLKDRAAALGLRKRGSNMRLTTLFGEQRDRGLNQFYDSMPCDIVHVFEGGVFKKVLEVTISFLPKFAEVSLKK